MRPKYANLRRIEDRFHGFTGARNPQRYHRESRGAAGACLLVSVYNLSTELSGMPMNLHLGVRYEETDITSAALSIKYGGSRWLSSMA